jgi:hypothetical protein
MISQSENIIKRLRKEGKVTEVIMTSEQISEWMKQMVKIKEEFRIKEINSWQAAKDVYLD